LKEGGIWMIPIRTILLGVLMLMLLTACQQETKNVPELEEQEVKEINSEELENDNKNRVIIKANQIVSYPISLYDQINFDLDRDGEDEQIEMYVNTGKDEKGEYVWDDGQNWLLVVKDGDKTYPLYDGWVQLGKLTFWLIESDETPMIILLKTGTAEFTLQTFTFNEKEQGFIQETQFNPENVNFWHHSN
jgi:hypothetical protein